MKYPRQVQTENRGYYRPPRLCPLAFSVHIRASLDSISEAVADSHGPTTHDYLSNMVANPPALRYFKLSYPVPYVAHVEVNRPERLNAFIEQ